MNQTLTWVSSEPYQTRPVRFLELWTWQGWRMKVYGISAHGLGQRLGMKPLPPVKVAAAQAVKIPKEVDDIVTSRCSMCHAAEPVWAGIVLPPKGVKLDTPGEIARHREAIRLHSVLTNAMPPNNITDMTADERRVLAAWVGGAAGQR